MPAFSRLFSFGKLWYNAAMGQLNLIIETLDEYRLVAKELGDRLTPFFAKPHKRNVIRIDVSGQDEIIRASFVQSLASTMMFGTDVTPSANQREANAYTRETKTAAGVARQVIIVDSQGIDYYLHQQRIPERSAQGPLIVQNPEYDAKLDAENAAKIDMNTQATVKIQKYAKGVYGASITINLLQFPMARFEQTLIKRGIITPPKGKLNYPFAGSKL